MTLSTVSILTQSRLKVSSERWVCQRRPNDSEWFSDADGDLAM